MSFRVKVDLSHFFQDEKSRCFVLVPANRKELLMKWLIQHLEAILAINLPESVVICVNDHILPLRESLELLCPSDELVLKPTGQKSQCSEKRNLEAEQSEKTLVDAVASVAYLNGSGNDDGCQKESNSGQIDHKLQTLKDQALSMLDSLSSHKRKRVRKRKRNSDIRTEKEPIHQLPKNQPIENDRIYQNSQVIETSVWDQGKLDKSKENVHRFYDTVDSIPNCDTSLEVNSSTTYISKTIKTTRPGRVVKSISHSDSL